MGNINDYLISKGDLSLKESKFNEIDSMILARISYLRFDKIEIEEKESLESISSKMKDLPNEEFLYNGDKELITNLGQSKRFKDMVVTDYIKTNDKEAEKQFGAVTIHISEKEMYISFIGTDSTIYGWKEDFNMAFMDDVPCQIAGKEYLERIAEKYPDKKIRVGGHSKGGNVAIYSAITANKEVKNRIIKVYNYDGPGFSKEFLKKYENDDFIDKMETYIPQDSIIGRILNHKEKITISLSKEKGIYQHDLYSWQVDKTDMIKSEENTSVSEDFNKLGDEWLETTTPEQRKIFIDAVFELFYSTDANTFGEMKKSLSTNISKILKKYRELDEKDRQIITEMIKIFTSSYLGIVKEKGATKFENTKEELNEKYNSLMKKINNMKKEE